MEPDANTPCPLPVPPLTLESEFGDPTIHNVYTQGAWAIWYNPSFFDASEAQETANFLQAARCRAVSDYATRDARNLGEGHFVNVYLHDPGGQDGFPEWWGNGVGTNVFSQPYITFPSFAWSDRENVDHEAFHIFQNDSDAPGFEYEGDSGWYVETTANWFAMQPDLNSTTAYLTVGSIAGNPHLALWHGFDNARPGDPIHWMTETRQYGLQVFLQHLIETTPLTGADAVSGFFTETTLLPQEYLVGIIGQDAMENAWGDFAALMTASFSSAPNAPMPNWVMNAAQRDRALDERAFLVADDPQPGIENDIAIVADLSSPFSGTLTPPDRLAPRPWSYNVIDIGAADGTMTVTLNATSPSDFEMRLVRLMEGSWNFSELASGQSVDLGDPSQAYIVVAATPEIYSGSQSLSYSLDVVAGQSPAPVPPPEPEPEPEPGPPPPPPQPPAPPPPPPPSPPPPPDPEPEPIPEPAPPPPPDPEPEPTPEPEPDPQPEPIPSPPPAPVPMPPPRAPLPAPPPAPVPGPPPEPVPVPIPEPVPAPPPDGVELIGDEGPNELTGSLGDDTLLGAGGDDTLTGGGGGDMIDGGPGQDTVIASGDFAPERVLMGETLQLQDGGLDMLMNVETIVFEDGTLLLDTPDSGVGFLFRLYDGVLGRTPDSPGMVFWHEVMDLGLSEGEVARYFLESNEYLSKHEGLENEAFVAQLYEDVLGRTPEPAGAAFWLWALDASLPREDALLAFSESEEHVRSTEEALGPGVFLEGYLL